MIMTQKGGNNITDRCDNTEDTMYPLQLSTSAEAMICGPRDRSKLVKIVRDRIQALDQLSRFLQFTPWLRATI